MLQRIHQAESEYLSIPKNQLDSIADGRVFGDEEDEYKNVKSADLVNHQIRVAIEMKDDLSDSPPELSPENPFFERTRDLLVISNRYKHDIEDAHKKFKNYPNYETAVLIRFNDFTFKTIHYLLGGLVRLTQYGRAPNTDINISRNCANCSLFLFHNIRHGELEFYKNPLSKRSNNTVTTIVQKLNPIVREIIQEDLIS